MTTAKTARWCGAEVSQQCCPSRIIKQIVCASEQGEQVLLFKCGGCSAASSQRRPIAPSLKPRRCSCYHSSSQHTCHRSTRGTHTATTERREMDIQREHVAWTSAYTSLYLTPTAAPAKHGHIAYVCTAKVQDMQAAILLRLPPHNHNVGHDKIVLTIATNKPTKGNLPPD